MHPSFSSSFRRSFFFYLSLAVVVFAALACADRARAEDPETMARLQTERGAEYLDVEIVSKDPHGILFRHRKGIAKLSYDDLPKAMRDKDGYSKEKAQEYLASRAAKSKEGAAVAPKMTGRTYRVSRAATAPVVLTGAYGYPPEFYPTPVVLVGPNLTVPVRDPASILTWNHLRRVQLIDAYIAHRHRIPADVGFPGYIAAPKQIFHRKGPKHREHLRSRGSHRGLSAHEFQGLSQLARGRVLGTRLAPPLAYGRGVPALAYGVR